MAAVFTKGQSQNRLRSMSLPQPFQYQGSKRALAALILRYLPETMPRLVEPFCGSAAVSIAAAARGRAKEFWLNDFNQPLAELLALMINSPKELAKFYAETAAGEIESDAGGNRGGPFVAGHAAGPERNDGGIALPFPRAD